MLAEGELRAEFGLQVHSVFNAYKHYQSWEVMPGLVRVFYPFLMLDRNSAVFLVSTLEYRGREKKTKKKKVSCQKPAPQSKITILLTNYSTGISPYVACTVPVDIKASGDHREDLENLNSAAEVYNFF